MCYLLTIAEMVAEFVWAGLPDGRSKGMIPALSNRRVPTVSFHQDIDV